MLRTVYLVLIVWIPYVSNPDYSTAGRFLLLFSYALVPKCTVTSWHHHNDIYSGLNDPGQ